MLQETKLALPYTQLCPGRGVWTAQPMPRVSQDWHICTSVQSRNEKDPLNHTSDTPKLPGYESIKSSRLPDLRAEEHAGDPPAVPQWDPDTSRTISTKWLMRHSPEAAPTSGFRQRGKRTSSDVLKMSGFKKRERFLSTETRRWEAASETASSGFIIFWINAQMKWEKQAPSSEP